MNKLRILHIAEPFATGTLSFLIELVKIQSKNHEVYILWGERPLTPPNVEELFPKEVHLYKISAFKGAMKTILNPKSYIEIYSLYREIVPDIVHLHSSAAGFVGRWGLPLHKVKAFYTPHGLSFLRKDISPLKRLIFRSIEWISSLRPAVIIGCSESEYEEIKDFPCKKTFINNAINTKEIDFLVHPNKFLPKIVVTGSICPQKNPILFNQIALILPNVEFVWIGDGSKEQRALLTAKNIRITGWLSREKALFELSQASFFLLPSLWEGLSYSLLEAMFLKKVCLTSNIPSFSYVIKDKKNGFICNKAECFAERIQQCLNGDFNLNKITNEAHQEVKNKYDVNFMAQAYETLYKNNEE